MKLKLDENGNVVVEDGKPVYVHDDGKEVAFDASYTLGTITRLNKEAQTNREEAKQFKEKLALFGDLDPEKAKNALSLVSKLDQKQLVDANGLKEYEEKIKAELGQSFKDAYEPQIKAANERAELAEKNFYDKVIVEGFTTSQFVKEKMSVPAEMVLSTFKGNFKIEEGKPVAYDSNGQKIYSRTDPSKLADFNEALETLVSGCSFKDQILKGNQSQGGGYSGGQQNKAGQKSMPREQFEKLTPSEKSGFIRDKGTVTE